MSSSTTNPATYLPDDLQLVFCDLAGTTLNDEINGIPLVTVALQTCFKHELQIDIPADQVNNHRGKEKKEMIQCILNEREKEISDEKLIQVLQTTHTASSSSSTTESIQLSNTSREELNRLIVNYLFDRFSLHLHNSLSLIPGEIEGVTALFQSLQRLNILIGVGSGFPASIVHALVRIVKWNSTGVETQPTAAEKTTKHLVSYIGSAEEAGKGRPDPTMLLDAMKKLNITDARKMVKVSA
jgi:beta-phosphoglucomutase-like phosphatase (HAD superfamily)